MKIERRDGSDERKILMAMIVSDSTLAQIIAIWKPGIFRSTWANIVAGWCAKYFERYSKAPRESIQDRFEAFASDPANDESSIKLIDKFLSRLSDDYESMREGVNVEYSVDLARSYFNRINARNLTQRVNGFLDSGKVDLALSEIESFNQLDTAIGSEIDVLSDPGNVREMLEENRSSLVKFPGAMGQFIAGEFIRDSFVVFLAPEKRGKSWALLDVAFRSIMTGRKVIYFECGDNSKNQVMRRLAARACKMPMPDERQKYQRHRSFEYNYPLEIKRAYGEQYAHVKSEARMSRSKIDWEFVFERFQQIAKKKSRNGESLLKLSCHPNSTISATGIRAKLVSLERRGWVPDVIIVDYADILAAPSGIDSLRDQINHSWKQLRSISQEFHCLLVSATQADAQSVGQWVLTRKNFSDDKRKIGHVTAMLGINQVEDEKEQGIYRYNYIVSRNQFFKETKCVYLASCLSMSNIAIRSCW